MTCTNCGVDVDKEPSVFCGECEGPYTGRAERAEQLLRDLVAACEDHHAGHPDTLAARCGLTGEQGRSRLDCALALRKKLLTALGEAYVRAKAYLESLP